MKKFLFLFIVSLSCTGIFAQQTEDIPFLMHPDAKAEVNLAQMKSFVDAGWFVPAWDLLDFYFGDNLTGIVTHYANVIFPDSIVRYQSSNSNITYNWLINVGQTFDPVSEMYPAPLSPFQSYRVDSMFVLAWYNVVDPLVTDTLIAEFVVGTPRTDPHFAHTIYVFDPETLRVSPPKMYGDTTQKGFFAKLTAPDKIIVKYPLSLADSTMQYGKYITFPVGIEVPVEKIIGVSLNFVPGYSYAYNNVVYSYMQGGLTQELNSFRIGLYSVDDNNLYPSLFYDAFDRHNANYYTHKNGRYVMYADAWRNERMASLITWGWDLGWRISAQDNVSIHESECNGIEVYPNPVSDILHVNLHENNSKLNVYAVDGRLVYSQYVSGFTQIDVSSWTNGMYFIETLMKGTSVRMKFIKH
jgi:hypothetical protein